MSFLILQNFEQRHMLKIICIFRLPFYIPRESHNFFNSLNTQINLICMKSWCLDYDKLYNKLELWQLFLAQ